MTEEDKRQLAELSGEPPKLRAGRPVLPLALDFEGAMAALKPKEAEFVRRVLAGDDRRTAYGRLHPEANANTCKKEGARIGSRILVRHALALGRKAGAVAAITGLAYDVKAADSQLVELIDEAREAEQYSAVANLVRERLRLHKLTDNSPAAIAGASFTLVIRGADGAEQVLQPGHVIDITPIQKGSDGNNSDGNTGI